MADITPYEIQTRSYGPIGGDPEIKEVTLKPAVHEGPTRTWTVGQEVTLVRAILEVDLPPLAVGSRGTVVRLRNPKIVTFIEVYFWDLEVRINLTMDDVSDSTLDSEDTPSHRTHLPDVVARSKPVSSDGGCFKRPAT